MNTPAFEPILFVISLVAILASLTFHEFAHALAALLQGDTTARDRGRLTLNPIAHVDLIGLLALITVGFGWGKPVPFNPYNLRDQKWGPVIVASAGPLANVLLFLISGVILKLLVVFTGLPMDNALLYFLAFMVQINAALFLFNLIPVPPLDGSKFLLSVLDHPKYARLRYTLETRGPLILLMVIVFDSFLFHGLIFGTILGGAISAATSIFGLGKFF